MCSNSLPEDVGWHAWSLRDFLGLAHACFADDHGVLLHTRVLQINKQVNCKTSEPCIGNKHSLSPLELLFPVADCDGLSDVRKSPSADRQLSV